MKNRKKDARRKNTSPWVRLVAIVVILVIAFEACKVVRMFTEISCTSWNKKLPTAYSETDKVLSAMSLSYLVYGLETCDSPMGSVSNILDNEQMGIISENADITRKDSEDPSTALIDSAEFIRSNTGDYRLIVEQRDDRSSFYGAAFADDDNKIVWIAYSGSVSIMDAFQSAELIFNPKLSRQEKCAIELYETVLTTDEIKNQSYNMILTGHSLGGALATIVSRVSGCTAVTINGADGIALDKINDILRNSSKGKKVTNYLTSPKGDKVSVKSVVQRLMFLGTTDGVVNHVYANNGMVENSHCVFGFIEFENDDINSPKLPENEVE